MDENPGDWPLRKRQSVRWPAGDCTAIAERGAIQNRGDHRRIPAARAAADGRLTLCATAVDPTSDLSFGGGVADTSNYPSDDLPEPGNSPAIQPCFDLANSGFYAGVWAANLKDDARNRTELDLSLGYRGETGCGLGYDLGYTLHFDDQTHAASSTSLNRGAGVGYALDDRTTLDLRVQDTASTSPLVALSVNYAFGDASN